MSLRGCCRLPRRPIIRNRPSVRRWAVKEALTSSEPRDERQGQDLEQSITAMSS